MVNHMAKKIAIIGSGMGGLAAGIYGQMNGYDTEIYEAHNVPGGQCASWKRNGYTFDACIHHLMGCKEGTRLGRLWQELGALSGSLAKTRELTAVAAPDGAMFIDYYNLDELRSHMMDIAPEDAKAIEQYIKGIRSFIGKEMMGRMMIDGFVGMAGILPAMLGNMKYMNTSMERYALEFNNPLLRRAIPLLEYSIPEIPAAVHFAKHAAGTEGDIAWPVGASVSLAASMAEKYRTLGGKLHLKQKVDKILTKNDSAVGLKLSGSGEVSADLVISNADGRKTIFEMLEGIYVNDDIRRWAGPNEDKTNWGTMIYYGVDRDLSTDPSALVLLQDRPVTLTGLPALSLELQTYGFDTTMAPAGKGVIKAELVSAYSYWDGLSEEEYQTRKQEAADTVLTVLEQHFKDLRTQVETVDVVTLKTWERFMGGTRGFNNGPLKPFSFMTLLSKPQATLPGLSGFYMAGTWVSGTGALFANALSGKHVMMQICQQDGRAFGVL